MEIPNAFIVNRLTDEKRIVTVHTFRGTGILPSTMSETERKEKMTSHIKPCIEAVS
jgi:hypothetical protein